MTNPVSELTDAILAQAAARVRAAAGMAGVQVPADPAIPFSELPVIVGVLRTIAQTCEQCGALVLTERKAMHAQWHLTLVRMVINPPTVEAEPAKATRAPLPPGAEP
jgi:hypothetical protein